MKLKLIIVLAILVMASGVWGEMVYRCDVCGKYFRIKDDKAIYGLTVVNNPKGKWLSSDSLAYIEHNPCEGEYICEDCMRSAIDSAKKYRDALNVPSINPKDCTVLPYYSPKLEDK